MKGSLLFDIMTTVISVPNERGSAGMGQEKAWLERELEEQIVI